MSRYSFACLVEFLASHGWHAVPVEGMEALSCSRAEPARQERRIRATWKAVRNFLGLS